MQYGAFLKGVAHGDLGQSLRNGQPVTSQILLRMPATAELALASMAVAVLVALPLGIIAAVWKGTWIDHSATTLSLVGISIPNFWLGPLLAIVFAVQLGWLPVGGADAWSSRLQLACSHGLKSAELPLFHVWADL